MRASSSVTSSPLAVVGCGFETANAADVVTAHVLAMYAEIQGVLEAKDIEYIHRMRVASRRLRSALAIFEGCFSGKVCQIYPGESRRAAHFLTAKLPLTLIGMGCLGFFPALNL